MHWFDHAGSSKVACAKNVLDVGFFFITRENVLWYRSSTHECFTQIFHAIVNLIIMKSKITRKDFKEKQFQAFLRVISRFSHTLNHITNLVYCKVC